MTKPAPFRPHTVWVGGASPAFGEKLTPKELKPPTLEDLKKNALTRCAMEALMQGVVTASGLAKISCKSFKTARKALNQIVSAGIATMEKRKSIRGTPAIFYSINQEVSL